MEDVLKLIYDISINGKIIDIKMIEKILLLVIDLKGINQYVSSMEVVLENNNKLASYCYFKRTIEINCNTIDYMLNNINKNLMLENEMEKRLYKNLSILQVILHELEHVSQEKIMNNENSFESFLLRCSSNVDPNLSFKLYEISTEERLAEIKSFDDIITIVNPIQCDYPNLYEIIQIDKLKRFLRGYHYNNKPYVQSPLIDYMIKSNNINNLEKLDWYNSNMDECLNLVVLEYILSERLKYGMPIKINEYAFLMKDLITSSNGKVKNMIRGVV